ncbi:MAG TPA: methyl-accepting chemotaxis protein [Methylotenera sp.]|nr:methyl-accepting chemotaxis protein [Methylotenera sp.]HPH04933.1 methyl-accepting chemotaxis protein [Methylotenera sp.]HPN01743.1 methyl-accepting chemotaxis protein [Methylotenera sp.]
MFASIINKLAGSTKATKKIIDEVTEFRALKAEINKARSVLEFDAKGKIIAINQNALKALGYSQSDIISEHHRVLVGSTESNRPEYEAFWENLQGGTTQTGKFKFKSKSGADVWFQGYYAPVINSKHQLIKVVSYLTDITAELTRAMILQGEDEALNQTFGVMECDMTGNITECNSIFMEPLGYKRDELVGHHVGILLPPEVGQSTEYKKMWEELNAGKSVTRQIRRISKDRKEYWFQSTYVPISDESGRPYKVVVYSYCITAEKMKIADYEGQLKAINKLQGVIQFDLTGKILDVNDNFAAVTGYSKQEIVGSHHSMFVDATYKSSSEYKAFWDKLGKGEPDGGVYKRIGKGGKEVWLQATYNPIFDANGKPYKVVKYATDITKSVIAEKEQAKNALESMMIKNSLESSSANLMVADNNGIITYMNPSTLAMMREIQTSMRKVLPNFDADKLIGQNFDVFHKNPAHQRSLLAGLSQKHTVEMPVSDLFLRITASPIFDEKGERIGSVAEWVNLTEEKRAESEIKDVVEAAASGDLSHRLDYSNVKGAAAKTMEAVNHLLDSVNDIIFQVREAGETINTAAGEISTGNNDLSSRTEQQASSLEETASSMEELASTVKQNAENAKQANQLAAAASGVAIKGGEVVGQVVSTMSSINESAKKIEDIISVIDGIAFQTNILALNAAVEAARAGEQGRGFAVVAGEVRNLAQRSASAAKEIKELITDSVRKTAEGTVQVENAGKTMQEIVSSVQRVTDIMGEISAASSEQSAGIDQVNNAITSMDEVTQQNAALVEEAAAAAESLVEQAVTLMDTVNGFKLNNANAGKTERRSNQSPMRSAAPSRPVASRTPATKPAPRPSPTKAVAKTGTDDGDWEEF